MNVIIHRHDMLFHYYVAYSNYDGTCMYQHDPRRLSHTCAGAQVHDYHPYIGYHSYSPCYCVIIYMANEGKWEEFLSFHFFLCFFFHYRGKTISIIIQVNTIVIVLHVADMVVISYGRISYGIIMSILQEWIIFSFFLSLLCRTLINF